MIRNLILRQRLRNATAESHRLMTHCNHLGEQTELPRCSASAVPYPHPSSAAVKELLKARRVRTNYFGAHFFSNPAWDILLLAYVAWLDREPLLVSTLLRASLVPATTTLRWVKALEQEGCLELSDDLSEATRCFIRLSRAGRTSMEHYFSSVGSSVI